MGVIFMKKTLKKSIAICMTTIFSISMIGCGGDNNSKSNNKQNTNVNTNTNNEASSGDDSAISDDSPYAGKGYDLSQQVNVVMYALGDIPADMDKVLEKVNNDYLIPNINTTLEIKFLN